MLSARRRKVVKFSHFAFAQTTIFYRITGNTEPVGTRTDCNQKSMRDYCNKQYHYPKTLPKSDAH